MVRIFPDSCVSPTKFILGIVRFVLAWPKIRVVHFSTITEEALTFAIAIAIAVRVVHQRGLFLVLIERLNRRRGDQRTENTDQSIQYAQGSDHQVTHRDEKENVMPIRQVIREIEAVAIQKRQSDQRERALPNAMAVDEMALAFDPHGRTQYKRWVEKDHNQHESAARFFGQREHFARQGFDRVDRELEDIDRSMNEALTDDATHGQMKETAEDFHFIEPTQQQHRPRYIVDRNDRRE